MKRALPAILLLLLYFPVLMLRSQTITTIAGTPKVFGFGGAGGPATSITIREPFNVVIDNGGNIFFSDPDNNRIWKINTAGIANVYAGTGVYGYTGDGGPAVSARIQGGYWLTVDNAGNLYFSGNTGVVRKIDATGIISTIITEAQANNITGSGDGGPLSAATFGQITKFIPDNAGNFYISDYSTGVVRKVNSAGIISTIAGTGVLGYSGDGGPATAAQLRNPYGVAFDNAGNIYIPDAGNNRIRKIDAAGIITTVAGNGTKGFSGDGGPAINATFFGPWQVVLDAGGNLYIDDAANYCVRKVDNAGIITTYAGVGGSSGAGYSGDGGPANAARMTDVTGIDIDNGGNIYIADQLNAIIRKVNNCPLAQIAQQPADNTICASGNTDFTLTSTGATGYQWQANSGGTWSDLSSGGVYGGTATSSLMITSATAGMNTIQYRCSVTNGCGTISTVPATLTVNTPSPPAVTIGAAAGAVCAGSTVSFKANPINGGNMPAYQWQVNGVATGTNSSTYTNSGLISGDIVSCMLTSNSACATTLTAASNSLTMAVNPMVTPAIGVTGPQDAICTGDPAAFTATATNGGATPAYQWQVNGKNVGTNSNTYMNQGLSNGDVISCMLTGSEVCATKPTAVSNSIAMAVNPLVTPAIGITGPPAAVCAGSVVTFTASTTNQGSSPAYQWQVNGLNTGTNSAMYTDPGLNNGDVVSCVLKGNAGCATVPAVVSNFVTMKVSPQVTPVISIATAAPSVCAGSAVSFTTTQTNGGTAPAYKWLVNGLPTGAAGTTYVSSSLNDGDAVSCVMTGNAVCSAVPGAISNTIIEQVRAIPATSVSIAASTTKICSGTQVSFRATPVNAGSLPGYQWQVNGIDLGPGKEVFITNGLANGDVVSCILTSKLSCSSPAVSQNKVVMTVNPNPAAVLIPDTIISLGRSVVLKAGITGPVTSYQWTPATGLDNPYIQAPVATPDNTTTYQLLVATDANCTAIGKITVDVFKTLRMPGAFTPNGDGKNDLFRIPPLLPVKIIAFTVYDRWGARVFYTDNSTAGWDGSFGGDPSPAGTYVWMIEYEDLLMKKPSLTKGTVILVR